MLLRKNRLYASMILLTSFICTIGSAQWLKVSPGTYVVNSGQIVLNNTSFHNAGGLLSNSAANFVIRGNQNSSIQGSGTTSFYGLELNKTAGNTLLQQNIKVLGVLKFTQGSLDLTDYNIQLIYPSGLLQNETEENRIFTNGIGEVYIQQNMSSPNNLNAGNLGATITSTQNLGLVTIRRGHKAQVSSQQESIKRYFTIEPSNNQNLDAGLRFSYFNNELNNLAENNLMLFNLNNTWQPLGKNVSDGNANFIQKNSLSSLYKTTLFALENAPLPLTLVSFDVSCKNGEADLKWITANEVNTKVFAVEKSIDGISWKVADHIPAQGAASQHNYATTLLDDASVFYRLKMEDIDGKFTYSAVRKLSCESLGEISIGPNPTTRVFNVSFQLKQKETFTIRLFDAKGSVLINKNITIDHNATEIFNVGYLTPGTYLLNITNSNGVNKIFKLVKK